MAKLTSLSCIDLVADVESLVREGILERLEVFYEVAEHRIFTYGLSSIGIEIFHTSFQGYKGRDILSCKIRRKKLLMSRERRYYTKLHLVYAALSNTYQTISQLANKTDAVLCKVMLYKLLHWGLAQIHPVSDRQWRAAKVVPTDLVHGNGLVTLDGRM